MKNTFKVLTVIAAAAFLFASCDVSNQRPAYTPSDSSEVTFLQNVASDAEIPASASTYEILVSRGNASGSVTVPLQANLPAEIKCPSSVTFNAGEYSASIALDVADFEIGKSYKGTITIPDANGNSETCINEISLILAKAYSWTSLGKGQFCEAFWEGFFCDCEVLKADGFDRYRFVNPYAVSEQSVAKPAYVEIWVINEDGNVQWNTYSTGFDYSGDSDFIKAYWPSDLDPKYASKEAYSAFWEDDIIVLVPCFYIDGVGGWASSNYPIAFCLPGRSQASFQQWLEDQGIWE